MLAELRVSQFAIIDSLQISFFPGFNILSGETGAGKSILIKSLGLLMGAKSSAQDIRSGKEQALIEGAFDLNTRTDILEKLTEMGVDCEDDTLVVRRVIHKNGKSRVYLNGQISSVSDLRKIVFPLVTLTNPTEAPLIEMTGQHENKNLTSASYQLDVVDQFCGNLKLRQSAADIFHSIQSLKEEIANIDKIAMEREQKIDFLRYQIQEIKDLELQEGEDEELLEKIKFQRHQGKWLDWFQEADYLINGQDPSLLNQLKSIMLRSPDDKHPELREFFQQLEQAHSLIEDCSFQLGQAKEKIINGDGRALDKMESRLNRIRKLQKKFGKDVDEILTKFGEMNQELETLESADELKSQLQKRLSQQNLEFAGLCAELSRKRKKGAEKLAKGINKELKDLNMKGLSVSIQVSSLEEAQSTGNDSLTFMVQVGKKEELRPLAKTASGGELSRILLSLKQVTGHGQNPRTFLFDEVDTGVSGPTAEKVGMKLKNLSSSHQVICVTHLPQVACYGDNHFFIEKHPEKKGVHMSVSHLNPKSRISEIARLISGEKVSKTSLAHARQLLQDARTI